MSTALPNRQKVRGWPRRLRQPDADHVLASDLAAFEQRWHRVVDETTATDGEQVSSLRAETVWVRRRRAGDG